MSVIPHISIELSIQAYSLLILGQDVSLTFMSGIILAGVLGIVPSLILGLYFPVTLGKYLPKTNASKAHQYKIEAESEENKNSQETDSQDSNGSTDKLGVEPTTDGYKDFITNLHVELYGKDAEESDPISQMKEIRNDFDEIQLQDDTTRSLKLIISDTRKEFGVYESEREGLAANFFLTLENYLRGSVKDEQMQTVLKQVGTNLSDGNNIRNEAKSIQTILSKYGYEENSIPAKAPWDDIYKELNRDGTLQTEFLKLVSILRVYDRELNSTQERMADLEEQVDTLHRLENELETDWIKSSLPDSTEKNYLVDAAQNGILGPRVVREVAKELQAEGKNDNLDLVVTLAKASTTSESTVRDTIELAIQQLRDYETIELKLDDVDHTSLNDRIEVLKDDLETMDSPVNSQLATSLLNSAENQLERISSANQMDLYAVSAKLDQLERLVETGRTEKEEKYLPELTEEVDQKRNSVEEMLQPGNYDVSTGHNISRKFVDLSDKFRQEAENEMKNGEIDRASAFLVATEQLLETVEKLYTERQSRQWLQHV